MTRDEAIKILSRIWGGNPQRDLANSYADAFVALGMLKLDEPKSIEQKAIDALWNKTPGVSPGRILQWLTEAGLQIIEKQGQ